MRRYSENSLGMSGRLSFVKFDAAGVVIVKSVCYGCRRYVLTSESEQGMACLQETRISDSGLIARCVM